MAQFVVVKNNIARFTPAVRQSLSEHLERVTADALGRAQQKAPVDTGQLRNSGFYEMEQDSAGEGEPLSSVLGFTAEHAAVVELGSSKMAAQPYLVPAVEEVADNLFAGVQRVVEAEARRLEAR
jgi:hypothetical protein